MMPFAGTLRAGAELTVFDPERSFMILDDQTVGVVASFA